MTDLKNPDCGCHKSGPSQTKDRRGLRSDSHFADIEVFRCGLCDQAWLRYHYENESYSRSGRVYLGAISEQALQSIQPGQAKALLESLPSYVCGGPGVGGGPYRSSGELSLWP